LKEFILFIVIGIIIIGGIVIYINLESKIVADNSNEKIIKINNDSNQTLDLLKMKIK